LGEYQSIYNDIYAIRIGGKWYLTEKTKGWFLEKSAFYFLSKFIIF
jgi:hypothetical protein